MLSKFEFPRYTYNDYKNWKEDWEMIDGYPLQLLPSASFKHSKIQSKLIFQGLSSLSSLNSFGKNCICELCNELDWIINDQTVVRPDIMIVCQEVKENFLTFPPTLVIEILSPSNIKTDRVIKFELYQENGVQFYIMVDPNKETVEVFELINNAYQQTENNTFQLTKTCQVSFDFEQLWK